MFQELMVPLDNLFYSKANTISTGYYNKYFIVSKEISGWRWCSSSYSNHYLKQNKFGEEICSPDFFSTWKEARDNACFVLQPYFPNNVIETKLGQSYSNSYCIHSLLYPKQKSSCLITKISEPQQTSLWSFKDDNKQAIIPQTFPTRQKCVEYLYNYVDNHLFQLYTAEKNAYKTTISLLQDPKKEISCIRWWMLFIKPEINLQNIF